jgi:hypothetical protein
VGKAGPASVDEDGRLDLIGDVWSRTKSAMLVWDETFQNDPQNRFFFLTRHNDVPPNSAASTKTLLPKYKNVILTRKARWGRLLEAEAVYE